MRNKILTIVVVILCITCLSLGLFSFSMSIDNGNNDNKKDNTVVNKADDKTDFSDINYMNSFDVSDFTGKSKNTIDIKSKVYTNNTITVLDSNYKISDELQNRMYDILNSYGASSSFYIVSLDDGMSIGYNVDRRYQTASSVKAPYALSIYREIANGNIDPERLLTYEERYHSIGTGLIKESEFGTQYTIKDLVKYSLHESDNVAHMMLHGNLGVRKYNQLMNGLGANDMTLSSGSAWGFMSPRSFALVWQDIYNFSLESPEGIEFMNILANGKYNYFKEVMPTIPSASKTGFADYDVVETGIVFDDKPYIAIIVANKGGNIGAYTQVLKIISCMNDIMNEYKDFSTK